MKIRNGFVSNSSSSSFLIIGQRIDIDNITHNDIKDNIIYAIGDNLSDGQDIFHIKTHEQLAFMKALEKNSVSDFEYVKAYSVSSEDDNEHEIDAEILPKEGKINFFNLWKDYNSSENLEQLQDRYDEYGYISKYMQQYLRNTKIKKIKNYFY